MKEGVDYSINLLKEINNLNINGSPVYTLFEEGDFSYWSFQQFSLREDINRFGQTKNFKEFLTEKQNSQNIIKILLARVVAFLISFLFILKILILRTKILAYSSDKLKKGTRKDPRLFTIYEELEKQHIPYGEIHHTLLNREFVLNVIKRRKLVLYLESLYFFADLFKRYDKKYIDKILLSQVSLDSFPCEEQQFVRYLLEKYGIYCKRSSRRVRLLKWILALSNIKILFTLDDFRYYHELMIACKDLDIKTIAFQHSNFDYLQGLDMLPPPMYAFPNIFYLWNEYWKTYISKKSQLFKFYENRLGVGGRTDGFTSQSSLLKEYKPSKLKVLVPYEMNINKEEISQFIRSVLNCKGVEVVFKGRTDVELSIQIAEYGIEEDVRNKKIEATTVLSKDLLKDIDVVVGVYTALLESMIEVGKPVLVLKTNYTVFHDLSAQGLAVSVDIMEKDICAKLHETASTSREMLDEHRVVLTAGMGNIQKTVKDILA